MPHPCPHHCPKGTGGGAAALLVLALIAAAAIARPAVRAADEVLRTAVDILEIAGIVLASAAALAAAGWAASAMLRARSLQSGDYGATAILPQAAQRDQEALALPERLAIEAPRQSLAGLQALADAHGYDVVPRQDAED